MCACVKYVKVYEGMSYPASKHRCLVREKHVLACKKILKYENASINLTLSIRNLVAPQ